MFQDINDDTEENTLSKFPDVTEKVISSQQSDADKDDKLECAENSDLSFEPSPPLSVHSTPVYKLQTEDTAGISQSVPNDDSAPNSPAGYCRNVKQRESKGKGKVNKGKIKMIVLRSVNWVSLWLKEFLISALSQNLKVFLEKCGYLLQKRHRENRGKEGREIENSHCTNGNTM